MTAIEWMKHPFEGTRVVEVSRVTKKQASVTAVLSAAVTAVFYFILKALGNANLLFGTISVTTSFAACALTYLRSPYYALAYAANDVVLIVLWVLASIDDSSYVPMIICFVCFLANDIYGFVNWCRMKKHQAA